MRVLLAAFLAASCLFGQGKVVLNPFPVGSNIGIVPPGSTGAAGPAGAAGPTGATGPAPSGTGPVIVVSGTASALSCTTGQVVWASSTAGAYCNTDLVNVAGASITTNKTVFVAPTSGRGIDAQGVSNSYVASLKGGATSGQSYGLAIDAGTNASDFPLRIRTVGLGDIFACAGNGRCGVGTTAPNSTLEITGNLAIGTTTAAQANGLLVSGLSKFAAGTQGAGNQGIQIGANEGLYSTTFAGNPALVVGTANDQIMFGALLVNMPYNSVYGLSSGSNPLSGADTGISRDSAGVIDFGTGAAGSTAGSWKATNGTLVLGGKYQCTKGTNATCGVSALAAGTVTVSTTAAATLAAAGGTGSKITLVLQNCTSCGSLSVGTVTNGTSFVINSTNVIDASNVYWEIGTIN